MTKIWLSGTAASKAICLPLGEYSKLKESGPILVSLRAEAGLFGATVNGSRVGSPRVS
jgi:hypothetical protein